MTIRLKNALRFSKKNTFFDKIANVGGISKLFPSK